MGVQQAEDGVALGYCLADDANGEQIVDLFDGDLLGDEFLLDGVEALDARLDAAFDIGFLQLGLEGRDDGGEEAFVGSAE